MVVDDMRITSGLRVGFWNPNPGFGNTPFTCKGHYTGIDLGRHLPGARLQQELMEGTLNFRVGVLFRPDLGRKNCLETILILENYIEEMFEYEDWDLAIG